MDSTTPGSQKQHMGPSRALPMTSARRTPHVDRRSGPDTQSGTPWSRDARHSLWLEVWACVVRRLVFPASHDQPKLKYCCRKATVSEKLMLCWRHYSNRGSFRLRSQSSSVSSVMGQRRRRWPMTELTLDGCVLWVVHYQGVLFRLCEELTRQSAAWQSAGWITVLRTDVFSVWHRAWTCLWSMIAPCNHLTGTVSCIGPHL